MTEGDRYDENARKECSNNRDIAQETLRAPAQSIPENIAIDIGRFGLFFHYQNVEILTFQLKQFKCHNIVLLLMILDMLVLFFGFINGIRYVWTCNIHIYSYNIIID